MIKWDAFEEKEGAMNMHKSGWADHCVLTDENERVSAD